MIPKLSKRRFCKAYREWLLARIRTRQERCPICGEPAQEAHHEGPHGMGRKPDDFWMVPTCKRCHTMNSLTAWLDAYRSRWDPDATADDVRESIAYSQLVYLSAFCQEMGAGVPTVGSRIVGSWEEYRGRVEMVISWIEREHPEWIQYREPRSGGGKRRPVKRSGVRPLTKGIGK